MPTLPVTLPTTLSNVGLAASSLEDVLALLPADWQTSERRPVVEALAGALLAMLREYQKRADFAAAQSDITRAIDACLDGLAADHGVNRARGEEQEHLRTRAMLPANVATPTAILAAVNAILAPATAKRAQVCETLLDRWFVTDGSASPEGMHSFVWDGHTESAPRYPDRLYEDDVGINHDVARPQASPGGALIFADAYGRALYLRVPSINDVDTPRVYADAGVNTSGEIGMFVTDGSGKGMAFMSADIMTGQQSYQAVADTVQQIKGHGIRFTLLVDRKL